jgi:chloramphenicol 3-O-phosphotransferase
LTPTTTTTSIRDWLIDCAVRWQRRNKLMVPRAGAVAGNDEVAAVIGPRDAAHQGPVAEPSIEALEAALEASLEVAHDVFAVDGQEAPPEAVEQTMIVPALNEIAAEPTSEAAEPDAEAIAPEADTPVSDAAEPVADDVAAPEADTDTLVEAPEAAVSEAPAIAEATEPVAAEVEAPAAVEETPEQATAESQDEPSAPTRRAADKREPVGPPIQSATLVVPPSPVTAPFVPTIDFEKMSAWQVMVLAGPAGSGKSSIAQQFSELLPKAVHIKVEPLRDRAYSMLVARPASRDGVVAQPEVWSGTTEEARQQAVVLSEAYVHTGHQVIIDDVIESSAELAPYLDGLADNATRVVTLMPSIEEMERRDRMRADGKSTGVRVRELHASMIRQMGQHSTVLDTSHETVFETVQRIIGMLEA